MKEDIKISEILYDTDGNIKPFYILSSERDIKETQIKSDENELDFKYSQGNISKEEYDKEKGSLEFTLSNQNKIYNCICPRIMFKNRQKAIPKCSWLNIKETYNHAWYTQN